MAANTETGHAINVANFEDLISFCKGYEAKYNPTNENIKIEALETLHFTANTAIENVNKAKSDFKNSTNQREIAFKDLNKQATKIINALAATDASPQTIKDARSIINKLTGKRVTPKKAVIKTEGEAESMVVEKINSTSQTGFDNRMNTFSQLIDLVAKESSYEPNEEDLKVNNLLSYMKVLKGTNTNAINAYTKISNARINRNKVLYEEKIGLCDVSIQVKNYVKSLFGSLSPEFKQVSGLKFVKYK